MMKTKYLMIAAAATMLAACSNDENEMDNSQVEARITAGVDGPQTRAVDDRWNADHIGVMVTDVTGTSDMENLYKNVEYATTSQETTATFSAVGAGIFFRDASETVTFAAYAPYQKTDAANALPGTAGAITVNTATHNGDNQETIDFLYASGATASKSNPTVTFANMGGGSDHSFKHKMARLDLVLQVSTADGFAADDIFSATAVKLSGLKHEGRFNVTSGATAVTADAATDDWNITACKKDDDATTRTYSLILLPQDVSTSKLSLTITIGGNNYKNTDDINPNLEAGKIYKYTITAKKTGLAVSGCTITNWDNGGTGNSDAVM